MSTRMNSKYQYFKQDSDKEFVISSMRKYIDEKQEIDKFLEDKDGDDDPNLFFGLDMEINPELSLLVEYNAALNENEMTRSNLALSRGGYLNAAIRWTFVDRLHIEMDFNNLLFNEENDNIDYFNRELKITYIEYF